MRVALGLMVGLVVGAGAVGIAWYASRAEPARAQWCFLDRGDVGYEERCFLTHEACQAAADGASASCERQ